MEQDFEIGDRVLLTAEDMQMPGTVIGLVQWHELFAPAATYKVLSVLGGLIIEAHAGQLERIQ